MVDYNSTEGYQENSDDMILISNIMIYHNIGGGSFYEVGGLATDDQLLSHACLAKATVATHYK